MQEILLEMVKTNTAEYLKNNALLQSKKNKLRQELAKMGILQKGGSNDFDHYKYFSEAQYKELFTGLFSKTGLELKTSVVECENFNGTQKQPFGRKLKLEFCLMDCETGFFELSYMIGEGLDKGDKASYKANTGAIKYYLADTFMVATGDDPENESPSGEVIKNKKTNQITMMPKATQSNPELVKKLESMLTEIEKAATLERYQIKSLSQLPNKILERLIERKQESAVKE